MVDRRSAIRSTDHRADKRVTFQSPMASNRSFTPTSFAGDFMQFDSFESPVISPEHHRQQEQQRIAMATRTPSKNPPLQPSKRRASYDVTPFNCDSPSFGVLHGDRLMESSNKRQASSDNVFVHRSNPSFPSLNGIILKQSREVAEIQEKLEAQLADVAPLSKSTLAFNRETQKLVVGLSVIDDAMNDYCKLEKTVTDKLDEILSRSTSQAFDFQAHQDQLNQWNDEHELRMARFHANG